MNKEIKEKWLKALRSGKYVQGKGKLRDKNDKFCCLGVLCDLYPDNTRWQKRSENSDNGSYDFLGENGYLPQEVMDWAGLDYQEGCSIPHPEVEGIYDSLADLNDDGKPFEEIAQVIERELRKNLKKQQLDSILKRQKYS